jgi:uracil-DNA glycosylase
VRAHSPLSGKIVELANRNRCGHDYRVSTSAIAGFIDSLSRVPSTPTAFNQYEKGSEANAIRRANLSLYLEQILEQKARILLLSEAPGYLGARLTGVPFTSEDILLCGIPELGMLGRERGYRKTDEFEQNSKEQSGTIVWQTLVSLDFLPLLFGSFPFHPHKLDNPRSNRKPTRAESALGRPFFLELMRIMEIERVVAVGNVAHASLAAAGIDTVKIRHPAQGGKNDFVAGMRRLCGRPSSAEEIV